MIENDTQIGKYTILNYKDGGAFGQVYKVKDVTMDRTSALKLIPIDPLKTDINEIKGIMEARTQFMCDHQNCVKLRSVEVLEIEKKPFVAIEMEFLEDGSVESQLSSRFFSVWESSNLIAGVLYGLQDAHNKGILHRDVKPGNILLDNNTPKLSDFGLSSAEKDEGGFGSAQGYITHCAPEIFSTGKTSELTDIYATGMTYYRLVNNIKDWRFFTKRHEKLISSGDLVKKLGYAPWVPQKVKRIINKACHKTTKNRFQSCQEFRQAVERLRFENDWALKLDVWHSSKLKRREIKIISNRKHKVEFKVEGKRRTENCKTFHNLEDAQVFAETLAAQTTLKT